MSKDYIVQIKVKNGPLLRAMREEGFETVAALARTGGLRKEAVYKFLALTMAPQKHDGSWTQSALDLAAVLRRMPEDLFPPQHIRDPLTINAGEFEASIEDVAAFLPREHDPYKEIEQSEASRLLYKTLETLDSRESSILKMRFGLDGNGERTFEELSDIFGVGKERIRQLEARALRKMKHPARSNYLIRPDA